jgi:Protein of unknown function (DUF2934)
MKKQPKPIQNAESQTGNAQANVVEPKIQPTERQIQQRAYELHKLRGGQSHPLLDWLQAERELKKMRLQQRNDSAI